LKISKANASLLLLILIIFLLLTGIGLAFYMFRSNPVEEALSGARVINILFVIEDEKKPLSAYVLMYYPGTRRIAVFDIPSELGLLISKTNRVDRIDSIYDPSRISSFENEVEKLLGVDIDFNIVISTENLVSAVDLLEGIEIFIPLPVSHREEDKLILFPSGMTVLDGDKASLYAVYSLPFEERDVELFRRQRFFIGFLGRQMQMNETLKNPDTAKLYYSLFKSGMNRRTLALLFDEFVNIDTGSINIQTVSGSLREVSGQMLIIPHWDGNLVKEVVRQTLTSLTRNIEEHHVMRAITVEVLNGTEINGLAGRTAEMLRNFGYDIISIGNADANSYESTEIIYRSDDDGVARAFADVIHCENIRREMYTLEELNEEYDEHEYKADLTLIIGRDFNGRYVSSQ
jgi:anionic cell wall polymer biosynthesis LytR-Cps2A-Psr (LCP) family protein